MPKEAYMLFGTFIALTIAYLTAKINSRTQLDIAEKNAQKELAIQENELFSTRLEGEVKLERERLEELHKILSKIALENSQTMSYIHSDSKLEISEFRTRYLENCERLHVAGAIVDLYYPEMSDAIKHIYGKANIFWGHQEGVLRTDLSTNRQGYESNLGEVISAGDEITKLVQSLKQNVLQRGKKLSEQLQSSYS